MAEPKKGIWQKIQENTVQPIKDGVTAMRESTAAKWLDIAIEKTDKFLGPSGKAWLANGLDELRQAVALGNGQIQAGNNPGLWGAITTGEATAERMEGDRDKALQVSYEVPAQEQVTIDKMRGNTKAPEVPKQQERGGMEM